MASSSSTASSSALVLSNGAGSSGSGFRGSRDVINDSPIHVESITFVQNTTKNVVWKRGTMRIKENGTILRFENNRKQGKIIGIEYLFAKQLSLSTRSPFVLSLRMDSSHPSNKETKFIQLNFGSSQYNYRLVADSINSTFERLRGTSQKKQSKKWSTGPPQNSICGGFLANAYGAKPRIITANTWRERRDAAAAKRAAAPRRRASTRVKRGAAVEAPEAVAPVGRLMLYSSIGSYKTVNAPADMDQFFEHPPGDVDDQKPFADGSGPSDQNLSTRYFNGYKFKNVKMEPAEDVQREELQEIQDQGHADDVLIEEVHEDQDYIARAEEAYIAPVEPQMDALQQQENQNHFENRQSPQENQHHFENRHVIGAAIGHVVGNGEAIAVTLINNCRVYDSVIHSAEINNSVLENTTVYASKINPPR